jgi:hypothetical protein
MQHSLKFGQQRDDERLLQGHGGAAQRKHGDHRRDGRRPGFGVRHTALPTHEVLTSPTVR